MQNDNSKFIINVDALKKLCSGIIGDTLIFVSYPQVRYLLSVIACIGSLGLRNPYYLHLAMQLSFITILAYLCVEDIKKRSISVYLASWLVLLVTGLIGLNYEELVKGKQYIPASLGELSLTVIGVSLAIPLVLFTLNIILIGFTKKNNLGFADVIVLIPTSAFSCLGYAVAKYTTISTIAILVLYFTLIAISNLVYLVILAIYVKIKKDSSIRRSVPFIVPITFSTIICFLVNFSV